MWVVDRRSGKRRGGKRRGRREQLVAAVVVAEQPDDSRSSPTRHESSDAPGENIRVYHWELELRSPRARPDPTASASRCDFQMPASSGQSDRRGSTRPRSSLHSCRPAVSAQESIAIGSAA